MRYLLLIYGDETRVDGMSEDEQGAHLQRWAEYDRAMRAAGIGVAGEALGRTATARTVRGGEHGRPLISDGPFAETREQLGGFIEIDVASLEEAVGWAERCPALVHGAVEVRPVVAM
jgi:hypothetical protein